MIYQLLEWWQNYCLISGFLLFIITYIVYFWMSAKDGKEFWDCVTLSWPISVFGFLCGLILPVVLVVLVLLSVVFVSALILSDESKHWYKNGGCQH